MNLEAHLQHTNYPLLGDSAHTFFNTLSFYLAYGDLLTLYVTDLSKKSTTCFWTCTQTSPILPVPLDFSLLTRTSRAQHHKCAFTKSELKPCPSPTDPGYWGFCLLYASLWIDMHWKDTENTENFLLNHFAHPQPESSRRLPRRSCSARWRPQAPKTETLLEGTWPRDLKERVSVHSSPGRAVHTQSSPLLGRGFTRNMVHTGAKLSFSQTRAEGSSNSRRLGQQPHPSDEFQVPCKLELQKKP